MSSAAFREDQVLYDDYEGPAVDFDMGRSIAERLGDKRAILMAHHGLITVGGSIDEAAHWFFTYEQAARVQLAASAAGPVRPMGPEQAKLARDGFGDAHLGWFSFQLLWDQILAEQPDFLEE